jgi:hypothetical protein
VHLQRILHNKLVAAPLRIRKRAQCLHDDGSDGPEFEHHFTVGTARRREDDQHHDWGVPISPTSQNQVLRKIATMRVTARDDTRDSGRPWRLDVAAGWAHLKVGSAADQTRGSVSDIAAAKSAYYIDLGRAPKPAGRKAQSS